MDTAGLKLLPDTFENITTSITKVKPMYNGFNVVKITKKNTKVPKILLKWQRALYIINLDFLLNRNFFNNIII